MASTGDYDYSSTPVGSISSVPPPSVSNNSNTKVAPKNAPGSRSDVGWKYGIAVDLTGRKIQCKFCKKSMTGGVYRLKHHLAGSQKDVGACPSVPDDVKKEMLELILSMQKNSLKKAGIVESDDEDEGVRKRQSNEVDEGASNFFKKRGSSSKVVQATINNMMKKSLKEDAYDDIAEFFYLNAIPFNAIASEEFQKMCDSIAKHGLGLKAPSVYDIKVKLLNKKYVETQEMIEVHRRHWKKTGCTIMTDGWTDTRRRSIINFLVNSTMGTVFLKSVDASNISKTADKLFEMIDAVVEEVGEENVIQVVTDNAANYKLAGEKLMEKRKRLYWTPCAAHCIDLMLEQFEKDLPVHRETIAKAKKITTYIYGRTYLISLLQKYTKGKDLIRPGVTRFATSYLTLGCLYENKSALLMLFHSDEWKSSRYAKLRDGKFIEDVAFDKPFWKNILICLKGAYPLIKVLRLVDSDTPAMGFIYGEIDKAKEKIRSSFNGDEDSYKPLWDIIDKRWDKQLRRPLHAATYFLNPQIHYSPEFNADYEVKKGLYECLERMTGSVEAANVIDRQIDDFKTRSKFLGCGLAKVGVMTKSPVQWWDSFGDQHPELQRIAIRILGLTCSSSGCERNWSAFDMVHTKRRNRLTQKKLNDVVFVMVNKKLAKKKKVRKPLVHDLEDLPSDDDWIVGEDNNDNMNLDEEANLGSEVQIQNEENMVEQAPLDEINIEIENLIQEERANDVMDDNDDAEFEALMDYRPT